MDTGEQRDGEPLQNKRTSRKGKARALNRWRKGFYRGTALAVPKQPSHFLVMIAECARPSPKHERTQSKDRYCRDSLPEAEVLDSSLRSSLRMTCEDLLRRSSPVPRSLAQIHPPSFRGSPLRPAATHLRRIGCAYGMRQRHSALGSLYDADRSLPEGSFARKLQKPKLAVQKICHSGRLNCTRLQHGSRGEARGANSNSSQPNVVLQQTFTVRFRRSFHPSGLMRLTNACSGRVDVDRLHAMHRRSIARLRRIQFRNRYLLNRRFEDM